MAQTTNYNLNMPNRGSQNWDEQVNQNFDKIDQELKDRANKIGILNNLNTQNKVDLVGAINETISSLNDRATHTEVDTKVSQIVSGSPKGTYATLSALQTAYPTGTNGIYVVLADGNWYYWNGSWTSGGVYQASQIADKSLTAYKLSEDIASIGKNKIDTSIAIIGYYNTSSVFNTASALRTIDKIKLEPNTYYTISAFADTPIYLTMWQNDVIGTTTYISYSTSINGYTFNMGVNTHVSVGFNATQINNVQLEIGTKKTLYEKFVHIINAPIDVTKSKNILDLATAPIPNYEAKGVAFNTDAENIHVAWTNSTVAYDSSTDEFVVFYNAQSKHINAFVDGVVYMRKKSVNSDMFSPPYIVADFRSESTGCKTQSSGILANGDYVSIVAKNVSGVVKTYLFRSKNKGITWDTGTEILIDGQSVLAYSGDVTGFKVLNSGRLLLWWWDNSKISHIMYSDDNGLTFKAGVVGNGAVSNATEIAIVELSDGVLVGLARDGVSSDYTISKPALFTMSYDSGITWTTPVQSKSITEMTECNGNFVYHKDTKLIEFIYSSRLEQKDNLRSIYQNVFTEEQAKNDMFGVGTRINTGYSDFGYVGTAISKNNTVGVFYYDSVRYNLDDTEIMYMEGSYYKQNNTDGYGVWKPKFNGDIILNKNTGFYYKDGNFAYLSFELEINTPNSISTWESLSIQNLPFNSFYDNNEAIANLTIYNNSNNPTLTLVGLLINSLDNRGTILQLKKINPTSRALENVVISDINSGMVIKGTINYLVTNKRLLPMNILKNSTFTDGSANWSVASGTWTFTDGQAKLTTTNGESIGIGLYQIVDVDPLTNYSAYCPVGNKMVCDQLDSKGAVVGTSISVGTDYSVLKTFKTDIKTRKIRVNLKRDGTSAGVYTFDNLQLTKYDI